MSFHPHRFGRYIIVDPIAVGGMAEIYRARLAVAKENKEGPDRIIVIKKVIANLSQNQEFLQMFEEEIKITVGLTHPNIIQIYDYGKNDDQYFMAMEYVEGKNLRQFVKRLADMKSMFSIDMSCYIISQVCHALAYAHAFKDRMSGKALGIVHRDISPQNVMISYDGAVKLFDFGIAKAKSASEATRAGVIKGKPSYLSPEQINGEELDGRCDIFALGIVLWELLTAKRLFVAETDMGVLRLIQSAKIEPPSTFNPAVPQSLDSIVIKSLTRDKNKRYQSSEEFQRDLHKFLYSFNPSFNPADLSYYAQELFKNEIKEDRVRLQKFLSMEPVGDGNSPQDDKGGKSAPKLSNKLADGLISTTDFNREMMDMVAQNTGSLNRPPELEIVNHSKGSPPAKAGTSTGTGAPPVPGKPPLPGQRRSGNTGMIQTPNTKSPIESSLPRKVHGPTDSMVIPPWSKGGGSAGSGGTPRRGGTQTALSREMTAQNDSKSSSLNKIALLAVVVVGMVFVARQYGMLCDTPLDSLATGCSRGPASTDTPKAPATAQTGHTRDPATAQMPEGPKPAVAEAVILVKTKLPLDFKVVVNGRQAAVNNGQFKVPLKEELRVEVSRVGFQTQRFVVPALDKAGTYGYDVPAIQLPMGTVSFSTLPAGKATFMMNGEKIFEGQTPIRDQPFPAGTYKVRTENSMLGISDEMEVVVEEGKVTRIERDIQLHK